MISSNFSCLRRVRGFGALALKNMKRIARWNLLTPAIVLVALAIPIYADDLKWTGKTGANDDPDWTTNAANMNWDNAGVADSYSEGDNVTFDDTAPGPGNITIIAAGVSPGQVEFRNSAKDYFLMGGKIMGATELLKNGTGVLSLHENSHTGDTRFFEGSIIVGHAKSFGTGTLRLTNTLTKTLSAGIPNLVVVNPIVVANETTLVLNDVAPIKFTGNVTLSRNFTIHVDTPTINWEFSGVISDNVPRKLIKTGPGILTLSGANTYRGGTDVMAGKLRVKNTAGSGTGSGDVTVQNDAILSGTGKIAGKVIVENGGKHEPGDSAGELGTGELKFGNTSKINYDLDMPNVVGPAGNNDLTTVTGNLTLDGKLSIIGGASFGAGNYTLFTYTGSLTDNTLDIVAIPNGFTGMIDTTAPGTVKIVVRVAPTFSPKVENIPDFYQHQQWGREKKVCAGDATKICKIDLDCLLADRPCNQVKVCAGDDTITCTALLDCTNAGVDGPCILDPGADRDWENGKRCGGWCRQTATLNQFYFFKKQGGVFDAILPDEIEMDPPVWLAEHNKQLPDLYDNTVPTSSAPLTFRLPQLKVCKKDGETRCTGPAECTAAGLIPADCIDDPRLEDPYHRVLQKLGVGPDKGVGKGLVLGQLFQVGKDVTYESSDGTAKKFFQVKVCKGDGTKTCTVDLDCPLAARPCNRVKVCAGDGTKTCIVDLDCPLAARPCNQVKVCAGDRRKTCTAELDCTNAGVAGPCNTGEGTLFDACVTFIRDGGIPNLILVVPLGFDVWWDGSFHAVTVAGFDKDPPTLYFADPDSNPLPGSTTGNENADGAPGAPDKWPDVTVHPELKGGDPATQRVKMRRFRATDAIPVSTRDGPNNQPTPGDISKRFVKAPMESNDPADTAKINKFKGLAGAKDRYNGVKIEFVLPLAIIKGGPQPGLQTAAGSKVFRVSPAQDEAISIDEFWLFPAGDTFQYVIDPSGWTVEPIAPLALDPWGNTRPFGGMHVFANDPSYALKNVEVLDILYETVSEQSLIAYDIIFGFESNPDNLRVQVFGGEMNKNFVQLIQCEGETIPTGACCDHDPFVGVCRDDVTQAGCNCGACEWLEDEVCADVPCVRQAIPTVSEWGLVVMTLLLFTGAKIYFGRRPLETRN